MRPKTLARPRDAGDRGLQEGDNKFTGTIDKVTIAVTPPPSSGREDEERGAASSRRASSEQP